MANGRWYASTITLSDGRIMAMSGLTQSGGTSNGGWTVSAPATTNRTYGSSVILPLLPPSYTPRVMNFGGGSPATHTTELIDLSSANPSWTPGPNMSTGRIQMNAVILPNGNVLAEGGSVNNESPDTPGKTADLYDPTTNTMRSGGTAAYSRLYHSVTVTPSGGFALRPSRRLPLRVSPRKRPNQERLISSGCSRVPQELRRTASIVEPAVARIPRHRWQQ